MHQKERAGLNGKHFFAGVVAFKSAHTAVLMCCVNAEVQTIRSRIMPEAFGPVVWRVAAIATVFIGDAVLGDDGVIRVDGGRAK